MKGLDINFNELFDIEGFLAFIMLTIFTFLIYYLAVFPKISGWHEASVVEPVNTILLAATPMPTPTTLSSSIVIPQSSEEGLSNTSTTKDGNNVKLELYLRVPKYVASFNDSIMELTILNPSEVEQNGKFYIEDEIKESDNNSDDKHIALSVDGRNTNYSNFTIPQYSRQTYSISLNAPRNIEGYTVKIHLGVLNCNSRGICVPYNGKDPFFEWTNNNSCKTKNKNDEEPSSDYICVSINTPQSIQYSAREQLLLSPWSNVFLITLIFIVTYLVDHCVTEKSRNAGLCTPINAIRVFKLMGISAIILLLVFISLRFMDVLGTIIIIIIIIFSYLNVRIFREHSLSEFVDYLRLLRQRIAGLSKRKNKKGNAQESPDHEDNSEIQRKQCEIERLGLSSILTQFETDGFCDVNLLVQRTEAFADCLRKSQVHVDQKEDNNISVEVLCLRSMSRVLSKMDSDAIHRYITALYRIFPETPLIHNLYESVVNDVIIDARPPTLDEIPKQNRPRFETRLKVRRRKIK